MTEGQWYRLLTPVWLHGMKNCHLIISDKILTLNHETRRYAPIAALFTPLCLSLLFSSPFSPSLGWSNVVVEKSPTANGAHLMVNLYALSSVGTIVEQLFGSARMLGIYLASGIAGNALGLFMQVSSFKLLLYFH